MLRPNLNQVNEAPTHMQHVQKCKMAIHLINKKQNVKKLKYWAVDLLGAPTGNWSTCGPAAILGVDAAGLTTEHQVLADRLAADYGVLRADGTIVTNGTEMTDLMTDGVFAESSFRLSQQLFKLNRPVYR